MKESTLKSKLAGQQAVVGTMISELACPEVVRALARAGFDFVMVDQEHGPTSLERLAPLYREAAATGVDLLVRVPDAQYHLIARTLDAGADGVMVPRVETVEQAQLAAAATKYPPLGRRGCGQRPLYTGQEPVPVPDYLEHMNRNTTLFVQIESRAALGRLDQILAVPGIDVALMGPADLSISLGVPGQAQDPQMLAAQERLVGTCGRAGVAAGIHWGDRDYLLAAYQAGMRVIMCGNDLGFFASGAARARQELGIP